MNSYFNSNYIVRLVIRWKWHLLVIMGAALVLSAVFSSPWFIKPKYKSFAVVYPSNLIPYSSETPTEQMLQLFKSEDIADSLIKKFDLGQHYNIGQADNFYNSKLKKELDGNLSIRKTEFESVIIEALDTDPKIACGMVKELILLMNQKARGLQREKTAEVVQIYSDQLISKQKQIDSIQARMDTLRNAYNLLDYNLQVKEYTKGYIKNANAGSAGNKEIKGFLDNMKKFGGEFLFLGGYLSSLTASYNDIKKEYDKSVSDLKKVLTYTNTVTSPVVADKKTYPVRWLIVLITAMASLFVSVIIITMIDKSKIESKPAGTPINES